MSTQYTVLPAFYDALNKEVNYEEYVQYVLNNISVPSPSVLDLGCGTGDVSILLSKKGVDVVALDISSEMLSLACHKAEKESVKVFYTCQDMISFSTGKKYDAVISTFDSLNYIKTKTGLYSAFNCVFDELKDGGLFIFDMNSEYKFKNVYADNSYVFDEDTVFCAWQNFYDEKSKLCDFYINIFAEENGRYNRYFEIQTERMFTFKEILQGLKKAGFTLLKSSSDYYGAPITNTTERYYIIAKK
jgi:SAM-dependent methyltransferase